MTLKKNLACALGWLKVKVSAFRFLWEIMKELLANQFYFTVLYADAH